MSDLDLFSELFYSVYGLNLFNEDHCEEDYLSFKSFEEADDIADRKRREDKAARRYREELRAEAETEGEAEIEAV